MRHRIAQLKEDIAEQATGMMKAANLRRVIRASNLHEKTDDGVLYMQIVCPYVNCGYDDENLKFEVNIPADPLEDLTVNLEAFQRHVDARHWEKVMDCQVFFNLFFFFYLNLLNILAILEISVNKIAFVFLIDHSRSRQEFFFCYFHVFFS